MGASTPSRVITANRTTDGGVVYLTAERKWSPTLSQARFFDHADDLEEWVEWSMGQQLDVCGPYTIEVQRSSAGIATALSARERLRADGEGEVLRRLGYSEAAADN